MEIVCQRSIPKCVCVYLCVCVLGGGVSAPRLLLPESPFLQSRILEVL